jgi:hypothetical protein
LPVLPQTYHDDVVGTAASGDEAHRPFLMGMALTEGVPVPCGGLVSMSAEAEIEASRQRLVDARARGEAH